MDERTLRTLVERIVLTELAKSGELFVPVMSSNRHIHLSQKDIDELFGKGYQLKKMRDLVQPGQYACEERVTLETPKGRLQLRVVGPARKETQIEFSIADAVSLGIMPMIRMSGDIAGTPGGVLKNGDRQIAIAQGIIIAARHLHLSVDQAEAYGLKDGDIVSLHVDGLRGIVYDNVVVRAGDGHVMEAHIDKDEANAAALKDGTLCRISKQPRMTEKTVMPSASTASISKKKERRLITEDDVKAAYAAGQTAIPHGDGDIITPLARDAAWELRITL